MSGVAHHKSGPEHGESVHLPQPTHWPIVLAFGCTLLAGGLVTNWMISVFGFALVLFGCVGWFRDVLPQERIEHVHVQVQPLEIETTRRSVKRLEIHAEHRQHLPLETYPVASGIKGGIAGGIAMIFPALIYGLITQHSIWYPVNLLGGAGVGNWANVTDAQIAQFHWDWLLIAIVIHGVTCLLVGLLYGALLPVLPRHPVILGGLVAPLLWTGLLHSSLGVINPALDDRISWGWFVVSQICFGVVAGFVVARDNRVRTGQRLPFFARIGIEAPGLLESNPDAGPPRADTKEKH